MRWNPIQLLIVNNSNAYVQPLLLLAGLLYLPQRQTTVTRAKKLKKNSTGKKIVSKIQKHVLRVSVVR
jgi:hypothetical protein